MVTSVADRKTVARTYGTRNLDRDESRVAPRLAPTDLPITSHTHNTAQSRFLGLPFPIAFARVVYYARSMELLTHDELVRLTPPERLALISQLWDSLEDDQLPLTAAQRAELDSRLATLDQDRREGITWATLKAELEQRCP
jgi:putative addiction module component (TIGR02574 family)